MEINFENLHLASITGANGAGKSSILDAITWSLFGIARARNDQVINQQSNLAQVIFDFEYEQQLFRIRRTKQIEKTMILEFNIWDQKAESWRSITEHSVNETQKRIHSSLRMDYDTFINASFFLQGKADQFTQLSPMVRKEILSNILGLEIWEDYLLRTKDIRRKLESDINRLENLLAEIKTELAKEDQNKFQLAEAEKELMEKLKTKESQTLLLDQAKQLENAKNNAELHIHQQEKDLGKNRSTLEKNRQNYERLTNELEILKTQIINSEVIEEKYNKWKAIRLDLDYWNQKSDIFHKKTYELNFLKNEITQHLDRLQSKRENFEKQLIEIDSIKKLIPIIDLELSQQTEKHNQFLISMDKKQNLNENLVEIQSKITEKQMAVKHLENQNSETREKLKAFRSAGPECPFCSQPLTKDHREKYEALILEEGIDRKNTIEKEAFEIENLKRKQIDIRSELTRIDHLERDFAQLQNKITENRVNLDRMKKSVNEWDENQAIEFQQILEQIENNNFLSTNRSKIDSLENELSQLQYNENQHITLKKNENELRKSEEEYRNLEAARSKFDPISKQLADLKIEISLDEKELVKKSEALKTMQVEFHKLYVSLPNIIQLKKDLDAMDKQINQVNLRIGAEKQKLDTISRKKSENKKLQSEVDQLTIEITRYKKLEEAFGKNGVPALLIEQALPEIEAHANNLLDQLTAGQLSVHFETQSEYKDKKRQDKKETLDILINDANGHTRAYEMFSGGEAFRINFAIRLALSQVLAKRSGAKLQTLVIDEGFGSQDHPGRSRLVETINQVKKDFAKILIITHLEELKDAFPGRIEVEKTASGSQVEVMVY
ncbi:MAG: SMC family ATPase [Anaerolineaceae bacterium]|nr:SMC family ATPase [Anaerolineaceae bacterium]